MTTLHTLVCSVFSPILHKKTPSIMSVMEGVMLFVVRNLIIGSTVRETVEF